VSWITEKAKQQVAAIEHDKKPVRELLEALLKINYYLFQRGATTEDLERVTIEVSPGIFESIKLDIGSEFTRKYVDTMSVMNGDEVKLAGITFKARR
jgi:hypothetical protein